MEKYRLERWEKKWGTLSAVIGSLILVLGCLAILI